MGARPRSDLRHHTLVPDVPALAPLRRRSPWRAFRDDWRPWRTLLVAALTPVAFSAFASVMQGRATADPVWVLLTTVASVGAAFVVTTYVGRGATGGGSCALGPLIGLLLAGWLVQENPTLVGVGLAAALVGVAAVQRVARPVC